MNVEELAKQMQVSQRTIFREISSINQGLREKNIHISVEDSTLTLKGGKKQIDDLRHSLGEIPKRLLLTPKQRMMFITAQLLLADEPLKSAFFSFQLNVTESTVSLYMDSILQWLAGKNLVLGRKRRQGLYVEGPEWNRRNALVALIYEYKPVEELMPYVYETKRDPVLHSFFRLLFGSQVLKMSKGITDLIPDRKMDDVPYLTFLFHTMISVKKMLEKHPISLPEELIQAPFIPDVSQFCEDLRSYLSQWGITDAESEVAYIAIHLPEICVDRTDGSFPDLGFDAAELTREVLFEVQEKLKINFSEDRQLLSALSRYFSAAVYRISLGMQVKNSLLEQVKEHYGTLFQAVEISCKHVFSKYNIRISEDEIGFVTMEIGAALETREAREKKISVLIVCPNGLVASRILFHKVQAIIRDLDRIEMASLKDWPESDARKYDLILSTVNLESKHQEKILIVSPFLSNEDISNIEGRVAEIRRKESAKLMPDSLAGVQKSPNQTDQDDQNLIHKMIENFLVEHIPAEPFQDMISRISFALVQKGMISEDREITRLILKREEIGSVVIPKTRLALLHIRSDAVYSPFIGVYRLEGETMMESVGFTREPVDTFLLMLARSNEKPYVLEKMGDISVNLIENKSFPENLRQDDAGKLREILSHLLEKE